jgi:hypothetical protein
MEFQKQSSLELLIRYEDELESQCARVWGWDRAKPEAQRIMARAEKEMRRESGIVVAMLPEIWRLEKLTP